MRDTFSKLLAEAAQKDDRLLLLTGDHGYALFDQFRKVSSDRFINCGIAEQNMVGMAAGLAKGGFRPVVYGLAAFVPMRVLEQIKMDVCYENLPVILVGDGAGIVYGQLGASHQCSEDVSALRPIPNIEIYSPADRHELVYCFEKMRERDVPAYLRFGKADCGDIHKGPVNVPLGDLIPVSLGFAGTAGSGNKIALIATGSMVSRAVEVQKRLPRASVWSAPMLLPINANQIREICGANQVVIAMEEHSINGGLGSIIAEVSSEMNAGSARARVIRIGIDGKFSELCGSYNYLMKAHGLDIESILAKIG